MNATKLSCAVVYMAVCLGLGGGFLYGGGEGGDVLENVL